MWINIQGFQVDLEYLLCQLSISKGDFFVCFASKCCRSSVRDGVFRQYNGDRSLRTLKKYIENEEWKDTAPVSNLFSPNSILYVDDLHLFHLIVSFSVPKDVLDQFIIWHIHRCESLLFASLFHRINLVFFPGYS